MIKIIDVGQQIADEDRRYREVVSFADESFGQKRVAADGRDFGGSRNSLYVDADRKDISKSRIAVTVTPTTLTIRVYGEKNLGEAKRFAEEAERKFEGNCIYLKHNLK